MAKGQNARYSGVRKENQPALTGDNNNEGSPCGESDTKSNSHMSPPPSNKRRLNEVLMESPSNEVTHNVNVNASTTMHCEVKVVKSRGLLDGEEFMKYMMMLRDHVDGIDPSQVDEWRTT